VFQPEQQTVVSHTQPGLHTVEHLFSSAALATALERYLLTTTDALADASSYVSCILYTGYEIYNIVDGLHTLGIYTTR
jgi:hypothetical protein